MRIVLSLSKILLAISFTFLSGKLIAGDKDSLIQKNLRKVEGTPLKSIQRNLYNLPSRQFESLEQYLSQKVFAVTDEKAILTDDFFQDFNVNNVDTGIQASRAKAAGATNEVEQKNAFVDYLQPSDIYKLPVGFKKKIGNSSEVTIAISSAIFKPTYAELTVFAKIKIPQLANPIFFGIQGLKLTYDGGILGNAKLVLLGDVAIPINGNNAALILKGSGMSTATGLPESPDKTYIAISCNGFKELGLTADIEFPRSLIIPINSDGLADPEGKVTASITNLKISDWNDIIATLSFNRPFQVKGLNGFVFTVQTAAFDFSDFRNNPDIVYPAGYEQKYLQPDNLSTWRGVYIKELSLALPKSFKNRDNTNRVSLGVRNLIIDNNGLTGVFFADHILSIAKGNAAGWKFSVDSLRIALEASRLTRAGFGGKIGLPVCKTAADGSDSASKTKFFEYSASISFGGDYVCRVTTQDVLDFDVFSAKATILPNSYIQLSGNEDEFSAEAVLNGSIGITSNKMNAADADSDRPSITEFKGIEFQELRIASKSPHFSARYFGYRGEIKFGNFPISFDNISLITPSENEVGISFVVQINLGDEKGESSSFTGRAGLRVIGEVNNESGGILNWKFSRIAIDSIYINANVKDAFKLIGWVKFFDNTSPSSSRYGRGFEGHLDVTFKGLANIVANVLFAKAPTFRYWYIDAKLSLTGTGLPAGPLFIKGFAGGAYCGMAKDGYEEPFPNGTGIKYHADSTAGLGVKIAVMFNVASTNAVSGQASFEMAFNRGGGLRYIGFFGMVRISYSFDIGGSSMGDYLNKQLKKTDAIEKLPSEIDLVRMKETDPTQAAKLIKERSETNAVQTDKDPAGSAPGGDGISAYIGIQYDFNRSSLHANFDLYINIAGGFLQGVGENSRAGWAVFHSEPGKWYLHAGTPTNPVGIKFGIGSFRIRTTSYLMLGYDMPAFPPPPAIVTSILAQTGSTYTSNIGKDALEGGRGIAFGAGISVTTGDLSVLFFYANFAAGIGFDVMLKDYGPNAHCEGSTSKIGMNGWYAQGQSYAYLQGELGIKIKLFFIKKKFVIIKGAAAALLQIRMPNPTWIGGALGVQVSILGGLISGHFSFKFSFGNDCLIVAGEQGTEEEIKIITEIKPDSNATGVSILSRPSVKFRAKPGQVLEIPREDGSGNDRFRPNLDQFKLFKGQVEVPGALNYNSTGDMLTLSPTAILSGLTQYKVYAKVSFQKFVNGYWVTYVENGRRVEEIQQFNFTTSAIPDTLPLSEVVKLYPFTDQRNLYKAEVNKGIVLMGRDFPEFFTRYPTWKVKIETPDGTPVSSADATTDGITKFNFVLPTDLQNNSTYNFLIMGENGGAPGSGPIKPAIKFKFTTSQFSTLAEKINALHVTQPIVGRVSSDAIDLQAAVNNYEGFELYELQGNSYTGNQPTIIAEADTSGELYYTQLIRPLIYQSYPLVAFDNTSFSLTGNGLLTYGVPPVKAITPSWYYVNSLQTGSFSSLTKIRFPFIYNCNKYYSLHFAEYRIKLINKYVGENDAPDGLGGISPDLDNNLRKIITEPFPFIPQGVYKAKITYILFDGTKGTSADFMYENPIE